MRSPVKEPRSYSRGFGIPIPDEDQLCELCESVPGSPQQCPGDRGHHGHGMIHTKDHRLVWACDSCTKIEAGL